MKKFYSIINKFFKMWIHSLNCFSSANLLINEKLIVKNLISINIKTKIDLAIISFHLSSPWTMLWIKEINNWCLSILKSVVRWSLGISECLLWYEDTVKEFTFILCSNWTDLVDSCACEWKSCIINSIEYKFILDIFTQYNFASCW